MRHVFKYFLQIKFIRVPRKKNTLPAQAEKKESGSVCIDSDFNFFFALMRVQIYFLGK